MSGENSQGSDAFAPLYPHEFARIVTFRKNNVAVPTTVWFADEQGKIYITTSPNAGKMKRIRNNPRVLLEPSDRVGNVLGGQVEARARELPVEEHEHAKGVLRRKYGAQFDNFFNSPGFQNAPRGFIEVVPA